MDGFRYHLLFLKKFPSVLAFDQYVLLSEITNELNNTNNNTNDDDDNDDDNNTTHFTPLLNLLTPKMKSWSKYLNRKKSKCLS